MEAAVSVVESKIAGEPSIRLRSADLEIELLPSLGGKMTSFRHLPSGRQWLWQDPHRPLRLARYADDFAAYDLGGFDECFPTIGECFYPESPFKGVLVPDHGEVWSLPWEVTLEPEGPLLKASGVRFPYTIEKQISLLDGGRCRIRYRVTSASTEDFKCVWSAHPLFAVEPGMQVLLPGHPQLSQEFSLSGDRLRRDGFLSQLQWPLVSGEDNRQHDLRELPFRMPPVVDKVYAGVLEAGWCAIWSPESGQYVGFGFDPAEVPRVGVCVNLGGLPSGTFAGRWAALEPCTGSTDRLDVSILRGHYRLLAAGQSIDWQLTLAAGTAPVFRGLAKDGSML